MWNTSRTILQQINIRGNYRIAEGLRRKCAMKIQSPANVTPLLNRLSIFLSRTTNILTRKQSHLIGSGDIRLAESRCCGPGGPNGGAILIMMQMPKKGLVSIGLYATKIFRPGIHTWKNLLVSAATAMVYHICRMENFFHPWK